MFLPYQRDIQPLISVVPRWQQLWVLFTLNQQTRHDAHGQILHGTTAVKRIGVERRRQPHQSFAIFQCQGGQYFSCQGLHGVHFGKTPHNEPGLHFDGGMRNPVKHLGHFQQVPKPNAAVALPEKQPHFFYVGHRWFARFQKRFRHLQQNVHQIDAVLIDQTQHTRVAQGFGLAHCVRGLLHHHVPKDVQDVVLEGVFQGLSFFVFTDFMEARQHQRPVAALEPLLVLSAKGRHVVKGTGVFGQRGQIFDELQRSCFGRAPGRFAFFLAQLFAFNLVRGPTLFLARHAAKEHGLAPGAQFQFLFRLRAIQTFGLRAQTGLSVHSVFVPGIGNGFIQFLATCQVLGGDAGGGSVSLQDRFQVVDQGIVCAEIDMKFLVGDVSHGAMVGEAGPFSAEV